MAKKNYSVSDAEAWRFDEIPMPEEWKRHIGNLSHPYRILIKGDPKNGKTEYLMRLMKMMAQCYGKVNFNSTEQGKSATLREALLRNKMQEVKGKLMICDASQKVFDTWYARLERPNSGKLIVLDSADYMKLTFEQYKQLNDRFKHKSIVVVCWKVNPIIKQLEHMMDVIVDEKDFKANPVSRMGGNTPYVIWEKRKSGQLSLL